MKFRVVQNQVNEIKRITRVYKDEWTWTFVCYTNAGVADTATHTAVINFSYKGSDDQILTKAAAVSDAEMAFTFADDDFDEAGEYVYQVVVTENSLSYVIAQGELYLANKIE